MHHNKLARAESDRIYMRISETRAKLDGVPRRAREFWESHFPLFEPLARPAFRRVFEICNQRRNGG